MRDNTNDTVAGSLGVLIFVGTIGSWIFASMLSWDWVEPKSFFGAFKVLFLWSIFGYIFQLLPGLVIAGIAKVFED